MQMTLSEKKRLAEYDCVGILIQALLEIRDGRCGDKKPSSVASRAISDWDSQRWVASNKAEAKYNEQSN